MVKVKTNISNRANYGSVRSTSAIKYIVAHYTANDGDTDEANANYFRNNVVKASAHLFVDDDSITISVPDEYVAWSVGGAKWSDCSKTGGGKMYGIITNYNSISIEMCDTQRNGKHDVSEKTLTNTIDLIVNKLIKYNLTPDAVYRHFDVNGKHCPEYFMAEGEWKKFKNRVVTAYNKAKGIKTEMKEEPVKNTTKTESTKPKTETAKVSTSYDVYVIKSGDTLSKIGKSIGVDWKALASANNIKAPYNITVGQVLKVPGKVYSQADFIKDVNTILGTKSAAEAFDKTVTISSSKNKNHKLVTPLERYMSALGYYTGAIEADSGKTPDFGSGMTSAIRKYQKEVVKASAKAQDGEVTAKKATWKKLLGL